MAWVLANPSDELTASRSMRETRRPNRRTVSTRVTRKPSPPTCISSRMTHWPNRVKSVLVERTARPVTVEAEVAVKKRVHESDGTRGHPRQDQQRSAEGNQPGQRGHQSDRDRHAALSVRVETFLDQSIDSGTAAFFRSGHHGRDATSRSFSRWPTANSVSSASSLVSTPGQGMRRFGRWIRSTVTS